MNRPQRTGPPPRRPVPHTNLIDPVPELRALLGPVVFLAWPKGTKGTNKKWKHLGLSDMTSAHLETLQRGNIGVALGQVSGGLCATDIDDDALVAPFLAFNPLLANTFQTHGNRGRVFWFRIKGVCPRSHKLKFCDGEFRADGNQSIVWGTHPSGKEYQWIVRKPVVEIEFSQINWPEGIGRTNETIENIQNHNVCSKGDVSKGAVCKGDVSKGCPPLSMLRLGACAADAALSDEAKEQIETAVEFGERSTQQNNKASFQACVALIQLRGVENLHDMPTIERFYFAERWFEQLKSKDRITPGKSKTHYFNDIMSSIKNAKNSPNQANPVPQAWLLAKSQPPPPEAAMFDGDKTMQDLIALCYQLHILSGQGEWFLARNLAGKIMGLDETETRNLSENFHVLIDCGILKVISQYEKGKRNATTYRYITQGHE